jgi:beta-galactosidase
LLGAGNGDVKDEDPYYDNRHRVWRGRAIAVVRGNGKGGKATLTVTGNGLPKAQVTLNGKR